MQQIFVPATVVGELMLGAYRAANTQKHLDQVASFLDNCSVLPVDAETADVYAKLKAGLMKKGKPIPENDIWIAAVALQHNLPLFTSDAHFKEIESIQLL
jgi:tRNA(fMet)-specific endonuclease VapC